MIYAQEAQRYQCLVAREDHAGELPRALNAIRPMAGLNLVDLGTGTGRVLRLARAAGARALGLDVSYHMLGEAQRVAAGAARLVCADNRALPLPAACSDFVVEGWSFGHLMGWYGEQWQPELRRSLDEMRRVARPGAALVLIETMGTGAREAAPPSDGLATMYRWLVEEMGFAEQVIATDYRFESLAEAIDLAGFFFGPDMAARVEENKWQVLPEFTGLWWQFA